jgi:hypothetical protein
MKLTHFAATGRIGRQVPDQGSCGAQNRDKL